MEFDSFDEFVVEVEEFGRRPTHPVDERNARDGPDASGDRPVASTRNEVRSLSEMVQRAARDFRGIHGRLEARLALGEHRFGSTPGATVLNA